MEDIKQIWDKVLEQLSEEVSAVSYDSWIKPIRAVAIDEDKIVLKVPFSVNKNMVMTKYFSLIESCLESAASHKFDIEVVVDDEKKVENSSEKYLHCKRGLLPCGKDDLSA